MSISSSRTGIQRASIIVGPGLVVLIAGLLSIPERDAGAGVTLANVALVIALVTVGAAIVDWGAGVTTSVAAALSLNFFHTEPYRTLRITDRRDVYSIVLLGVLGLTVSAVTAARVRSGVARLRRIDMHRAGHDMAGWIVEDRPAPEVWSAAIHAASNDLGLVSARLTERSPVELANIRRRWVGDDDRTVELPPLGAAMALHGRHTENCWLILTPRPGMGSVSVDRRAVVALADAVELALEPLADGSVGATAVEGHDGRHQPVAHEEVRLDG